jgi:hypothetical protein
MLRTRVAAVFVCCLGGLTTSAVAAASPPHAATATRRPVANVGRNVGAQTSSPGTLTLDEFKQLGATATDSPEGMQDSPGKPKGRGTPTVHGRRQTIGSQIDSSVAAEPPERKNNKLNWHGFVTRALPAVGRLYAFETDDSGNEVLGRCTGTVVTKGLVVTAGHCVTGNITKMLFVPGQTWNDLQSSDMFDIKAPYGVWTAVQWWTPSSYKDATSNLDWGVVQIAQGDNGSYVGDVVGSWPMRTGIKFNDGARIYSVGYPAAGHWSTVDGGEGRGQYACDDTWAAGSWLASGTGYELWISCPMNGGASGGPWFVQLSDGSWVIGGVNNQCNDDIKSDDTDTYCTPVSQDIRSLVFDSSFLDFWNQVLPLVT